MSERPHSDEGSSAAPSCLRAEHSRLRAAECPQVRTHCSEAAEVPDHHHGRAPVAGYTQPRSTSQLSVGYGALPRFARLRCRSLNPEPIRHADTHPCRVPSAAQSCPGSPAHVGPRNVLLSVRRGARLEQTAINMALAFIVRGILFWGAIAGLLYLLWKLPSCSPTIRASASQCRGNEERRLELHP
ncbi:hypothetical protein ABIA45_007245 [Bradyrhizobium sp. USDA 336]